MHAAPGCLCRDRRPGPTWWDRDTDLWHLGTAWVMLYNTLGCYITYPPQAV